MELFGIGPGELMIIMVLALIIVGPQKLPEIGRNLGRTIGEFKAQTDALRSVMTLDPPARPVAAQPAPATPALIHSDERVTALQAYARPMAVPVAEDGAVTVIAPVDTRIDHELAS